MNGVDPSGKLTTCVTITDEDGNSQRTCTDHGDSDNEINFLANQQHFGGDSGERAFLAGLQSKVLAEQISANNEAGGSLEDLAVAFGISAQIANGLAPSSTPQQDKSLFEKIPDGKGGIVYRNKKDGSYWSKERGGDRAHGGSTWKRWPNKRDFEKQNPKTRMTIRADGTIRDRGKTKSRGGTRKKK